MRTKCDFRTKAVFCCRRPSNKKSLPQVRLLNKSRRHLLLIADMHQAKSIWPSSRTRYAKKISKLSLFHKCLS
jgi:hypothetical protein